MKESILKLREQGYSYNQIVAELGCAKSTVAYYCGQDQKTKQLTRSKDKRSKLRAHVQEGKNKPCMDCGQSYPYFIMEYDHRPGEEKLYTIALVSSIPSLAALKTEMAKCDVVCANCHKYRTWERLVKSGESIPLDIGS